MISLLGVLSVTPPLPMEPGSSWLGSPAIFLRRQASAKFDESLTFRPPLRLVICRLVIEGLRVVLPSTLSFAAMFLIAWAILQLEHVLPLPLLLLTLPGAVPGRRRAADGGGGAAEMARDGSVSAARRAALVALRLADGTDHRLVRECGRALAAQLAGWHAVYGAGCGCSARTLAAVCISIRRI